MRWPLWWRRFRSQIAAARALVPPGPHRHVRAELSELLVAGGGAGCIGAGAGGDSCCARRCESVARAPACEGAGACPRQQHVRQGSRARLQHAGVLGYLHGLLQVLWASCACGRSQRETLRARGDGRAADRGLGRPCMSAATWALWPWRKSALTRKAARTWRARRFDRPTAPPQHDPRRPRPAYPHYSKPAACDSHLGVTGHEFHAPELIVAIKWHGLSQAQE